MRIDQSAPWKALERHQTGLEDVHLRDLFAEDAGRFDRFSLSLDGLFLDYSKNRITTETMALLGDLAKAAGVGEQRDRMFAGDAINTTESRAVLHVALRAAPDQPMRTGGRDVMADVGRVLARMEDFCGRVHDGRWRGATGEPVETVVNIGIGGSDLGPAMVTKALSAFCVERPGVRFVSNVDGAALAETLKGLDPARTLFVVASKTFTTQETLTNARSARRWVTDALGEDAIARHFVALSTNEAAVADFGIDADNMFPFWDWVGGRYSLWSAIGLSIALAIGFASFRQLLAGAHAMDEHFRTAPLDANMPVLLALIGIWHTNFFGWPAQAVLPYAENLARLPAYLQQLDMESNGKRVTRDGKPVTWTTGPILFGEPGTNGQHAFYQLLHQGTQIVPADFIAVAESAYGYEEHHRILLANCLAQTEALMTGRTTDEVRTAMQAKGADAATIGRLAAHRTFDGNRPTNTLILDRLDPYHLGLLIALYEHKVFVQGTVWQINSFDQWGVELGKELAGPILGELDGSAKDAAHNASTRGLIDRLARRTRHNGDAR